MELNIWMFILALFIAILYMYIAELKRKLKVAKINLDLELERQHIERRAYLETQIEKMDKKARWIPITIPDSNIARKILINMELDKFTDISEKLDKQVSEITQITEIKKAKQEFHYWDKVKVIEWFFKGQEWIVISRQSRWLYYWKDIGYNYIILVTKDRQFVVWENDLELIK